MGLALAEGQASRAGTLAARPAATAVPPGTLYVTDDGILYRSTGSTWRRLTPYELWSDESTTNVTAIGTSRVDIANLEPVTFDVEAGFAVHVEFRSQWNIHTTLGGALVGFISDNTGADATAVIWSQGSTAEARANNSKLGPLVVTERITTPGTYTRKPQVQSSGSAGGNLLGAGSIKQRFRVWEVPYI